MNTNLQPIANMLLLNGTLTDLLDSAKTALSTGYLYWITKKAKRDITSVYRMTCRALRHFSSDFINTDDEIAKEKHSAQK